jgi:hypothetical protein
VRRAARIVAALGLLIAALGPLTGPAGAADAPSMEARLLLGGHARVGSWVAISVHLRNDGPAVSGELRLAGGEQGSTRFGTVVDLPTQSDKTYLLYAQPPSFGTQLELVLTDGDRTIATAKAPFTRHETTQLVVAVVAEHPERIVRSIDLPANEAQLAAVVVSLAPEDLPERVEAWGVLDRLVWQDLDSDRLTGTQLAALRGWVAGGGRLVLAGGTVGPKAFSAFPDVLVPYRPLVTTDVPAAALAGVLGELPTNATTLPALSGELIGGRALATTGDRVVAAERSYGSGSVTLLGFDPSAGWIAETDASKNLWRRLLPARGSSGLAFTNDNMLVNAVTQVPALALPPIDGLIALFGAYILLIGPLNYIVLKRLDRREWAWLTMPFFIVVFAAGAYSYGAILRGSDMIVNEVAIVRGAPGTTDGTAQVYLGIFSPSRGVYQVRVPGGALLSAPIVDATFGGEPTTTLDVVQGDPARVRNLIVGFGALRSIRAETAVTVPLIETDLELVDGHLRGTVRNASAQRLQRPAVVLGGTVAVLPDLEPGQEATMNVIVGVDRSGLSLADRVVGQLFFTDDGMTTDSTRLNVRHSIVDQLTWDPSRGSSNLLPADGPVVLAWGSGDLVDVEIEGQRPNRVGNVLFYLPARLTITGLTRFRSDMIRSTVVEGDTMPFSKEPGSIGFGRGSTTIAYRPIGLEGRIDATELAIGFGIFDGGLTIPPMQVEPLPSVAPPCPEPPTDACVVPDGLPDVEVFDVEAQAWRRLPHPDQSVSYSVSDPARFVDPGSGTVLVRYVNDRSDEVYFNPTLTISGIVR